MSYNPFTGQVEKSAIGKVHKFNIADDAVAVIPISNPSAVMLLSAVEAFGEIMAFVKFDSSTLNSIVTQGGVYTLTTGTLTGISGVDGATTLSIHTDGNIYLENRSGVARDYILTFFNQG